LLRQLRSWLPEAPRSQVVPPILGRPARTWPTAKSSPGFDVNPTNASNVVGTWQQDRWSNGGARGLVAGVSFNGGSTWTQVTIPKITVCSGGTVANGGDFLRATDPWLSFSPNGALYMFSMGLDPDPATGGFGKTGMMVSKSTNGGLTWSDPITVIRDENPRLLNDKNSITADPTNSNFVYAVWDRLDIPPGEFKNRAERGAFGTAVALGFKGAAMFSRTTNGGASWEPARIIYNPGGINQTIGNQIVVQPNGTVIDFFTEILNFKNSDKGNQFEANISLIRSFDHGASWSRGQPTRLAKMLSIGVTDPQTGGPVRTGDILPEVAVDRTNGNLYAVWQDARFSGFANDSVAFSMSTDGGVTWSAPIKVNQTPGSGGNAQAFTTSVHVLDDGTVGVSYYDFRNNDSGSDLKTDHFLVHCHSSCASAGNWTAETQITTASFDMRQAPFSRGFFTGDYEGLASDNTNDDFVALFSQGVSGADPASVYFSRVAGP